MSSITIAMLSLIISCGAAAISGYQAFLNRGQLEISKDQEVRQLRAYVGPVWAQLAKNSNFNHLDIQINFHNHGQTPAYNFNFTWHSNTEIKTADNIYNTSNSDSSVNNSDTLFPSADQYWNSDFQITQFPEDFSSDRRIITFFGTAFYADAFNNNRKVEFCYIIKKDDIVSLAKSAGPIGLQNCNAFGSST